MTSAFHCCCLLVATAPYRIAVVALDDSPSVAAAMEYVATQQQAAGSVVQSQTSLATRLTGMSQLKIPDETAIRRMLADARDQEARFDTQGANELRQQIARAFDLAIRPSPAMRILAGQAGLEMAAALLAEGQPEAAARVAKETWRRFGSTPIDTARLAPQTVAFLESQRLAVASHHKVQLTVMSSRPGILFADGTRLGEVHGQLSVLLPHGRYRFWLEWQGGLSLPHPGDLNMTPLEVTIDAELEEHIEIDRIVEVKCQPDCPAVLVALGKRVEVARVIGVGAALADATNASRDQRFRLVEVDVNTGETSESVIELDASGSEVEIMDADQTDQQMAPFSPLYLIPFGGGQLAQDRPYFALGYLGLQLGLLAGCLWVHSQRPNDLDLSKERELDQQKDLALGLFATAVVASVVEAVVVGLVFGE